MSLVAATALVTVVGAGCAVEPESPPGLEVGFEAPPLETGEGASLWFEADWSVVAEGAPRAGEVLTIHYALERLTRCRGTHNGYPAWNLDAHVRFSPGGQTATATVRRFEAPSGVPTNVAHPVPAAFEIPADATSVEVWFSNTGLDGTSWCEAWDSSYGRNYQFAVVGPPAWMGEAVVRIRRDSSDPCAGGAPLADGFAYDTWARQRAVVRNACFRVWSPGVTDWDNPDLWRDLDVRARYRFDGDAPFETAHVDFDRRVGNDARYAWSLAAVDPFRPYQCPDAPVEADERYVYAEVEMYFEVNGVALRPAGADSVYRGVFSDHVNDPWRAANCAP